MNIVSQRELAAFKSFLSSHDSFVIAGHREPDGDCVASCVGLSYIVAHLEKPYILLNEGPFKRSEIRQYGSLFAHSLPFSAHDARETGLLIADCSELSRLGDAIADDVKGLDAFIIDHHKTANVGDIPHIINPTAPAAACIVQQLFEAIVGQPDREQAEMLFFGLATDTGFFRFLDSGSSEVFALAARLVAAGANPKAICEHITGGKPWPTRRLLGAMIEKSERYLNGRLIVGREDLDDTTRWGAEGRDSDAYYSIMLETEGVEAVALMRQDTEFTCTLGFRSKGECDVSAVAAKFGGGGHKNAAGASVNGRIETLIPSVLKEFAKIL